MNRTHRDDRLYLIDGLESCCINAFDERVEDETLGLIDSFTCQCGKTFTPTVVWRATNPGWKITNKKPGGEPG